MTRKTVVYCIAILFFYSCSSKPGNADIKRKILLDYICPESVQVSTMNVISIKEATSFVDLKGYECIVSGEVIWKDGCNEFGSSLPAGYKEKFENKKVILIKADEGWR